MSGWLQDEVVLITGGGSGLGLALVERFLAEGAKLAVLERSPEKCAMLQAHFAADVVVTQGDVCSGADNQRAVDAAVARFGKLDCF
ncbi:SDR family NAD(P)-dependent oxidoreductase, partial [Klebsiella pneumoniae]|nr:SDR family NAD(P)-dependent oxidoreductase [Klebsiella pneumoniae]